VATLGYTYATAGRKSEALAMLQELKHRASTHYVSPVLLAQVQLGLEAKDEALQSLEDAYKVKATDLLWIGVRPIFEPLSAEPRFQAIVQSIGLA
jgi:predicted Zn-dependent protease